MKAEEREDLCAAIVVARHHKLNRRSYLLMVVEPNQIPR